MNLKTVLCLIPAIATAAACSGGDTGPCNDCPDAGGTWVWQFDPNGTVSQDCQDQQLGLPQGTLELKQVGSALSATVSGVDVRGTLYDSYDFGLSGASAGDGGQATSVTVTGRYVPAQPSLDAGERLEGNFSLGRGACALSRRYSAVR